MFFSLFFMMKKQERKGEKAFEKPVGGV